MLDQFESGCLCIIPGIREVSFRLDAHIVGIVNELATPSGGQYSGLGVVIKVVLVIGSIALLFDAGLATLHEGAIPFGGQDNGFRVESVEVVGIGYVLVLATDLGHIIDSSIRIHKLSVPAFALNGYIVLFLAQRHF